MDLKPLNNKGEFPPPSEKFNKKAIIIASIIVGVLLLGGISYGVYYKVSNTSKQVKNEVTNTDSNQVLPSTNTNTSKTSDTSDWQIYNSTKFGYSINYPGNYQVSSYNNENDIYIEKIKNKGKGVVVKVRDLVSLDDFIKEYEADDPGINKIVKQEDYLLDGISAKKLTGQIALGVDDNIIFANRNNMTLTINFLGYLFLGESNEHLDIISTFKFTDWEYFLVNELGIKFKVAKELKDDLVYSYEYNLDKTTGKIHKIARFTTKTLIAKNEQSCSLGANPLGVLSLYEGEKADYNNTDLGIYLRDREIKQFDTFFVEYVGPQSPCSFDLEYETGQIRLFKENLPAGIEEIK